MDPTDFFGRNVLAVLSEVREHGGIVDYSQIEGDEFLKFPENGYYLHSRSCTGEISDCRIYFESRDNYFPAKAINRGVFDGLVTLDDFAAKFGPSVRDIRALKIPGTEPTLPGKMFEYQGLIVTAYSSDENAVAYINVKPSGSSCVPGC